MQALRNMVYVEAKTIMRTIEHYTPPGLKIEKKHGVLVLGKEEKGR